MENFAEKLEYQQKQSHLSWIEIAERLGIGTRNIYCWRRDGVMPAADKMDKLSKIFGVPVGYWYDEEGSNNSELQTKLEEKEKELTEYDKDLKSLNRTFRLYKETVESELALKDAEIQRLKKELELRKR